MGKHTKYSLDNIIRKVKSRFINSALNYINTQFKNKNRKLLKIICNQSKEINRNKNILWLKNTMKNVFYEDISNKANNTNKNYNRELIDIIYKEKDEEKVIELLNLTVGEFMKLYCSKNKINDMKQLDEVIKELKKEGESDINYLKCAKNTLQLKLDSTNFIVKFLERDEGDSEIHYTTYYTTVFIMNNFKNYDEIDIDKSNIIYKPFNNRSHIQSNIICRIEY